jgi:hypothetical protein
MRSLYVACLALGVASAAFTVPAYCEPGLLIPGAHRGPSVVPDRARQVENFRRHDEWREREEWRRRGAFREHRWDCGREWDCRH